MKRITTIFIAFIALSLSVSGQSKLRVFGHLTQGFAISDDHQIFGIPTDGTSDYRNLALQFRFDVNETNNFVVQLAHKRLGKNPTMLVNQDLELDWGFFEHHFSPAFSIKFGKVQMPLGIMNELRDVSVLLPFYRAPTSVYSESRASSEAVNGLVLSYTHQLGKNWSVRSDVFAGQWSWLEWYKLQSLLTNEVTLVVDEADIERAFGYQGWLFTPIDGLRFGFSGYYGILTRGLSFVQLANLQEPSITSYLASIEGDFERFTIRAEDNIISVVNSPFYMNSYYIQGGLSLVGDLSMNLQYETIKFHQFYVPFDMGNLIGGTYIDKKFHQDFGVALNYAFSANLVIKVEAHTTEGFLVEDQYINPYIQSQLKTRYAILSLASSF